MCQSLLLLACHGSNRQPAVNDLMRVRADALRQLNLFDHVAVAFKQGEQTFDSILDTMRPGFVAVLPITTSEGYFTNDYIPHELAKNRRYRETTVEFLQPVGVHPAIAQIVADRVEHLSRTLDLTNPQIVLIGHGTPRHPQSTHSTERLAALLNEKAMPTITAYLDDEPTVESIPRRSSAGTILVIPFLIAPGPHATHDIPRRLGLSSIDKGPVDETVGRHRIVYDRPIGEAPAIGDLLETLARSASDRLAKLRRLVEHTRHD